MNKQLHSAFGVMHQRRSKALGSIFGALALGGLGLILWFVFGWVWLGIGPVVGAILAVPAAINSFRSEQVETFKRECGTLDVRRREAAHDRDDT